jgi:tetratricopeptide (TPR) repeat protein
LIQALADKGVVHPGPGWGEQAIEAVANHIEGRIDKKVHGYALASLARVLLWAGKNEDAARTARQALDIAGDYTEVLVNANSILVSVYQRLGKPELGLQLLYSSISKAPGALELRLKLGQMLFKRPFLQLEEAAANLLIVCQQLPYYDLAQQTFGQVMAKRGRPRIAYASLMEALRLNPKNAGARKTLSQIRPLLGRQLPSPKPSQILLDIYPSRAPRELIQMRRDATGRPVPDGIEVEFYENGRIKHFVDIDYGKRNGIEMSWDTEGRVISREVYRQGVRVNDASGK